MGGNKKYEGVDLKHKASCGALDHAPVYDCHHCKVMCGDNRCVDEHTVCECVIGICAIEPMSSDAVDDVGFEYGGEGGLCVCDDNVKVAPFVIGEFHYLCKIQVPGLPPDMIPILPKTITFQVQNGRRCNLQYLENTAPTVASVCIYCEQDTRSIAKICISSQSQKCQGNAGTIHDDITGGFLGQPSGDALVSIK